MKIRRSTIKSIKPTGKIDCSAFYDTTKINTCIKRNIEKNEERLANGRRNLDSNNNRVRK